MSLAAFLIHGTLNGTQDADPSALFDSPEARPSRRQDIVLDEALLPLMHERGSIDWPTLLQAAVDHKDLPQANLLRWLSEGLHYQLVESDPADSGAWQLTKAGEQRAQELASQEPVATR